MTIVIDANILLSAIINPYGPIPKLIFLYNSKIDFVIPQFAVTELELHKFRICKKSRIPLSHFEGLWKDLISRLLVLSSENIDAETIVNAQQLASNIDEKDSIYIAYTLALNALLWTGDLKLYKGLRRKKFNKIVTTAELSRIIKGL
jgi:predicted nucleic acid-binding protein